jgi:hypothetical protein
MTMGQRIERASLRTTAILLAVALVVAAAYALIPPSGQIREEAAEAEQARKHSPAAGSEAALRRVVDEIQHGQPDPVRGQLPQSQRLLTELGPLQSLAPAGGNGRFDFYRARYVNGSVRWAISMTKSGAIERLGFGAISPSTPRQWIVSYAGTPLGDRVEEITVKLAELLALAAFGRLALRIRL